MNENNQLRFNPVGLVGCDRTEPEVVDLYKAPDHKDSPKNRIKKVKGAQKKRERKQLWQIGVCLL